MKEESLKEVLIELQEQNKDLMNLFMNLIVSKNQLMEQVSKDFSEVRNDIKKLNSTENDEFPDLSKNITDELNKITSKRTDNIIENIEERFDMMEENLEKIKALF